MKTQFPIHIRLARSIFRAISPREDRDALQQSLEMLYEDIARENGDIYAAGWLWAQVFRSVPGLISASLYWRYTMLRSYLKVAVRNLKKQKIYSLINISGLAIGMACCIFILLFVQDELSYDDYHTNANRIYRVTLSEVINGATDHYAGVPFSAAQTFAAELPEILAWTRLVRRAGLLEFNERQIDAPNIFFADSTFFEIFDFQFISGIPDRVLDAPASIVLSQNAAERLFADENPVGKTVLLDGAEALTVTAVMQNVPVNSHFSFDYLVSISTIESEQSRRFNSWFGIVGWAYFLVAPDTNPQDLETKFAGIVATHIGERLRNAGVNMTHRLQKLTDIHLKSNLQFEINPNGDMKTVYILSVIAAFILFIACLNFINLSTARSASRHKEVGLRKVMGAQKKQLVSQFLSESVVLSFLGLLGAVSLVGNLLPLFNRFTGKSITLEQLNQPWFWLALPALLLITGILAGTYPAFYLSAYKPVSVFRAQWQKILRRPVLRSGLVVLQFAISIILIVSTLVILRQIHFMKQSKLGFDKEQVLVLPLRHGILLRRFAAFGNELIRHPAVRAVSLTNDIPGRAKHVMTFRQEGKNGEQSIPLQIISADYQFVETYGLEIIAGRNFSQKYSTDSGCFLINETAATKLGWQGNALGKKLWRDPQYKREIVGVVRDFHFKSFKEAIEPLVIQLQPEVGGYNYERFLSVKLAPQNFDAAISLIKEKWQVFNVQRDFEYFFIDDYFNRLYQSEERLSRILTLFAGLAILLACLGLFGLISFSIEQRTKEIGIRKALGASIASLVWLLTREYARLVTVANLLALPAAWFLIHAVWLRNFQYKIHPGVSEFVFTGFVIILIALVTIGYQAGKAARTNPVNALKYE